MAETRVCFNHDIGPEAFESCLVFIAIPQVFRLSSLIIILFALKRPILETAVRWLHKLQMPDASRLRSVGPFQAV